MRLLSFAQFLEACRSRLTQEQIEALSPEDYYFKLEGGYVGLKLDPWDMHVWVSIAVGNGMGFLRQLRKACKNLGVKTASFFCKFDSPSYHIARYYRAFIKESDTKYEDGSPAFLCVVRV